MLFSSAYYANYGLKSIYEKVMEKQRLSFEDGLNLFQCPNINAVGALAHHARMQKHGDKTYYVVNRHVNYTNVCVNDCVFCAYRRDDESKKGAFTLSKEDILQKVQGATDTPLQLDELHIVGGCHPKLPLAWFEDLLQSIRAIRPNLMIKAFTLVEIAHFADLAKITTLEVLQRLKKAGLTMTTGGGAEIFAPDIRQKLCPRKADADRWLKVAGEAHGLGIKGNATMLYGHIESYEHRLDHLIRLREQQDKSGGFTCFIPLPFQTENSALILPKEKQGPQRGIDQLRTIAVARLMLDNIEHIKAYWIMMGAKLAQTALWYGANDLDGTIVEEHIGHMAGANSADALTIEELEYMIKQSGFTPIRRNAVFEQVHTNLEGKA